MSDIDDVVPDSEFSDDLSARIAERAGPEVQPSASLFQLPQELYAHMSGGVLPDQRVIQLDLHNPTALHHTHCLSPAIRKGLETLYEMHPKSIQCAQIVSTGIHPTLAALVQQDNQYVILSFNSSNQVIPAGTDETIARKAYDSFVQGLLVLVQPAQE